MRSLYKGMVGFGLVSIPVALYKALDDPRVEMHYLHRPCHSRIRYQKVCPVCGVAVDAEDLVKGTPLPDGRFVVVPVEDTVTSPDHTINIVSFHELKDIDPVFYDQSYWLKPGPGGQKAYRLLADTMRDTGKVALAEMTLRSRLSLALIRTFGETALMLHRMYYPETLRQEGAHFGDIDVAISTRERDLARMLVDHMAEPFVPEHYPDEARRRLLETIQSLMPQAVTPKTVDTPNRDVLDLMQRLKASVASARSGAS